MPTTKEPTNADRAERAARLMDIYAQRMGYLTSQEKYEVGVRDLLADLRHYCDEHGIQFHVEDRAAYQNYAAEVGGKE